MPSKDKKNFLSLNYDKLILAAAALLLAGSGLWLWTRSQKQEDEANDFVKTIRPPVAGKNAVSTPVGDEEYLRVVQSAEKPLALPPAVSMLIAPVRTICYSEGCRRPILPDDDICPYCGDDQPDGKGPEESLFPPEGLPDVWRIANNLPLFEAVGHLDSDNDGFTNLEEYYAGTDPRDPESRPAYIGYLRVEEVKRQPFPYVLRGKSKGLNDLYTFQINRLSDGRTFNVKTNQVNREMAPWTVGSYELFTSVEKRPGMKDREVELAKIILTDGKEKITLVEKAEPLYNSFVVTFVCPKKPGGEPIVVRNGQDFEFDGVNYSVPQVLEDNSVSVPIVRESDNVRIVIPDKSVPPPVVMPREKKEEKEVQEEKEVHEVQEEEKEED